MSGSLVVTAPADHRRRQSASALGGPVDGPRRPVLVVAGGATRQASVAAGLAALVADARADDVDVVLVHDAARPLAPAVAGRARSSTRCATGTPRWCPACR